MKSKHETNRDEWAPCVPMRTATSCSFRHFGLSYYRCLRFLPRIRCVRLNEVKYDRASVLAMPIKTREDRMARYTTLAQNFCQQTKTGPRQNVLKQIYGTTTGLRWQYHHGDQLARCIEKHLTKEDKAYLHKVYQQKDKHVVKMRRNYRAQQIAHAPCRLLPADTWELAHPVKSSQTFQGRSDDKRRIAQQHHNNEDTSFAHEQWQLLPADASELADPMKSSAGFQQSADGKRQIGQQQHNNEETSFDKDQI